MSIGPGANGVALMNAQRDQWEINHAQQIVDRQNAEAKDKRQAEIEAEKKMIAAAYEYERQEERKKAINAGANFERDDYVSLKMSPETLQHYNDVVLPKTIKFIENSTNKEWVNNNWDGAIGRVFDVTYDLTGPKYMVEVYRLSGTSTYNPNFNITRNPSSQIIENDMLERDMTRITLGRAEVKTIKDAQTKNWEYKGQGWVYNPPSSAGGKRRSKSNNKPKKSAKRVKTSKRSKSRRTRRQRK